MGHRTGLALFAAVLIIGVAWTAESWAQAKISTVGILTFSPLSDDYSQQHWLGPFRRTLAEQGWIEGKNVSFEVRVAVGDPSQLAEAAADLVRHKVDVIFAPAAPLVRAAHAATPSIPIVGVDFTTDPVAEGYVQSYGHPGGNLTGVFLAAPEFAGKWIQMLKAVVPNLSRVAVLWDPAPGPAHLRAVQEIARSAGLRLQIVEVRKPEDIEPAFSAFRGHPQALIILPSPMIYVSSDQLAKQTLKHRLLATSMAYLFAEAGGVISYGPDLEAAHERAAVLVAKILGGAKAADLPVERPTKVQLIVNLKSAKALGLTVPESVLYRADEVIR